MLNLEDAIKNTVERICRDRNEDDKIYIHVSDLAGEAIRQHAKILHDMRRANEEAQELTKAKADGRLIEVVRCKDCNRLNIVQVGTHKVGLCDLGERVTFGCKPNDYCNYGEKAVDGEKHTIDAQVNTFSDNILGLIVTMALKEVKKKAMEDDYPCTDHDCYDKGNYHTGCESCPKYKKVTGGKEDE